MDAYVGATVLSGYSPGELDVELSLIERCKKQDFDAFGKFVDLYQSRVMGFVRRMVRSQDDVSDVSQEVFIRAFQSFPRFDGRCSAKTWLFRIAYNLCVDRSRKESRIPNQIALSQSQDSDEEIDVPDARWEPEQMMMDNELADHLEQAIMGMSEKLRVVLLLHDREDQSYEEIAETLGLPIGTVKSRLFLARNYLQSALLPYLQSEKI